MAQLGITARGNPMICLPEGQYRRHIRAIWLEPPSINAIDGYGNTIELRYEQRTKSCCLIGHIPRPAAHAAKARG